jgi:hypothetical protein
VNRQRLPEMRPNYLACRIGELRCKRETGIKLDF